MKKFNKGDIVVRTEDLTSLMENPNNFMAVGGKYVVEWCDDFENIAFHGSDRVYNAAKFELFVEPPKVNFKNMKFRVNSPEHSKEIQEALFEMGYRWSSHGTNVMFTDDGDIWLCTEKTGVIHRTNQDLCTYQEHTIETTKSYKLIPVVPKETIVIGGVAYSKEDVENALKGLKPTK